MKNLIAFALLIVSGIASADQPAPKQGFNCDIPAVELTKISVIELESWLAHCQVKTNVVDHAVKNAVENKDKVSAWGQASKDFAHAIGIAAKELGIAVNDFLNSPAGWILAGLLIFNFGGSTFISAILWIFMVCVWLFSFYKFYKAFAFSYEYQYVPILWGLTSVKRVASEKSIDPEWTSGFVCFGTVFTVSFMIISGVALF
jgi:hypothetical protein